MKFKLVINNLDPEIKIDDKAIDNLINKLFEPFNYRKIHQSAIEIIMPFTFRHLIKSYKNVSYCMQLIYNMKEMISKYKNIYEEDLKPGLHMYSNNNFNIWYEFLPGKIDKE